MHIGALVRYLGLNEYADRVDWMLFSESVLRLVSDDDAVTMGDTISSYHEMRSLQRALNDGYKTPSISHSVSPFPSSTSHLVNHPSLQHLNRYQTPRPPKKSTIRHHAARPCHLCSVCRVGNGCPWSCPGSSS